MLPVRPTLIQFVLFVSAFIFYSTLWPTAPAIMPDSGSYLRFAQDLADFRIDQLHERTPGYPILLLLTGASHSVDRTLFHVSLLLHFASIWLLSSVLFSAGLSVINIVFFSGIVLLPPFVEPAAYVLTETLAEAMLVLALTSLVLWQVKLKSIWIFIAAASVGFAALTRPTYQLLAFGVAAWLTTAYFLKFSGVRARREVIIPSGILICGTLLFVGGYAYHNYKKFGYFGITYKLGISLTQKTVHVIERLPDEYASIREALIRGRNADLIASRGTELGYISAIVPELTRITGLNEVQLAKYLLKINLLLIRTAPLNYFQDVVMAFGRYWFPTSSEFANFNSRLLQAVWAILHFSVIGAFGLGFAVIIGTIMFLKISNFDGDQLDTPIRLVEFIYGLAGTIVFYTAGISCFIDVGDPRHRVPTDVIIVFMIVLGGHLWWRQVALARAFVQRYRVQATR